MNSLKRFIAGVSACIIPWSLTLSAGFAGPFLEVGAGFSNIQMQVQGFTPYNNGINSSANPLNTGGQGLVALGYSRPFPHFNLATQIFYITGNKNSGLIAGYAIENSYRYGIMMSNHHKNTAGISFQPGWNFNDNTLGYLKFAWVRSQHDAWLSSAYDPYHPAITHSVKVLNGIGMGLGIQHLLSQSIYLGVDVLGIVYQKHILQQAPREISVRTRQYLGFITLGYQF